MQNELQKQKGKLYIMDIGFRILKCDLKLKDEAKLKEYAT
jgi:hypothetical protein